MIKLRLQRELVLMKTKYANYFTVDLIEDNLELWQVGLTGEDGTVFEGEKFTLDFNFSGYPLTPPQVKFVGNIPEDEHIYSNGFICINILHDQWSPALAIHGICLSILSVLSSAPKKARPYDNDEICEFSQSLGMKYSDFKWNYDDDMC